ncbi:MAG: translation initiation factor IF-5A [Candidatus Bathyarchaeota archaeon]|nr:MAG: translation initiation factor IF-5A [Candidatus Bathyarchaeota archaeon]
MSKPVSLGSLKKGSYIVIDGEPCQIVEATHSKPGKHGSAKVRLVAIGVFDDVKRSRVSPVTARVEVPLIEKKTGQVVSISEGNVQLMDLENYEIFWSNLPSDEEIRSKLEPGTEVEYWVVLGKKKIMRVKGS